MTERTKTLYAVLGAIMDIEQRDETGNATLAATPAVVGYFDLAAQLSARMGRSLMQAQVFRVRGMRIVMTVNANDPENDVGFAMSGRLAWLTPNSQRVAAHKHYAQRWRAQAALGITNFPDIEPGRGRQFIVKYETAQPSPAYGSIMEDDESATQVVPSLIGTSGSGTQTSIFDEYRELYPAHPAPTDGTDQRMYTLAASEIEDYLPWTYSASQGVWQDSVSNVPTHDQGHIHEGGIFLPDGMAMEWMCGLARVDLTYTTPYISPTDPDWMRLSFIALVEGWRPLR